MVKMGVQYSLWGGSVVNLGTERHREKYFDDIDSFRLPGEPCCCCMALCEATLVHRRADARSHLPDLLCRDGVVAQCVARCFTRRGRWQPVIVHAVGLAGCFAMTELRHGSNVAGLQTEALLDVASDEWVVHTPDEGAIKVGPVCGRTEHPESGGRLDAK